MANDALPGPIEFTREEISQARQGNYGPAEKRLKRELAARSRLLVAGGKPRREAELRRIPRNRTGKS